MPTAEFDIIQVFIQAGFAGLFIWLLYDTRKDAKEREHESREREKQLYELLNRYVNSMDSVTDKLALVAENLARLEERFNSMYAEICGDTFKRRT